MSAEQNAQIVRESIEAAVRQDWNRLRSLYAEDAILLGTPEPVRGNDAIVKLWQGCHDEVPGITCEIANIIAQGDMAGGSRIPRRRSVHLPGPGRQDRLQSNLWVFG